MEEMGQAAHDPRLIDAGWILGCAAMVFMMQAGFLCLETGLVRAKNIINVAIKNVVDICIATMLYWMFGFALMFGASHGGLFGTSGFLFDWSLDYWKSSFFIFHVVFCGTAVTIISGAVAERMRFAGYLFISIVVAGFLYPLAGHWMWGGVAEGQATGWLIRLGFIDFAGSTVVHSVGGWVALAAIIVIGPRIGRFGDERRPMTCHNLPMAVLGALLLWFGWFGFNSGSTLGLTKGIPMIIGNTAMAAAAGGLVGLAMGWHRTGRPNVTDVINGLLAGLVSITASCHIMTTIAAVMIGAVGGFICVLGTRILERYGVDDAIGAVPVHCFSGVWGTLAVALFASPSAFGTGLSRWQQFQIQSLGVVTCFGFAFGGGYVIIRLIDRVFPLRVSADDEIIGLNISEHQAPNELFTLLSEMEHQRQTGDFSKHVDAEPYTQVGQIALQYNRVLDKMVVEGDRAKQLAHIATIAKEEAESAKCQLEQRVEELDEFNRLAVGRELKMIDLKQEVNGLLNDVGAQKRYDVSDDAVNNDSTAGERIPDVGSDTKA